MTTAASPQAGPPVPTLGVPLLVAKAQLMLVLDDTTTVSVASRLSRP